MKSRNVELPKGGTLEITASDEFYVIVRRHFGLAEGAEVSDDQIRMYVYGAVKGAVNKHEKVERVFG